MSAAANKTKFSLKVLPKQFWFIVLGIILLLFFFWYLSTRRQTFLSPLGEGNILSYLTGNKVQVIGFLPYWNINEELETDFSAIDQLMYFGLIVGEDGMLIRQENGETEPGWYKLKTSNKFKQIMANAKKQNKKVLLTIICFDPDVTDIVVSDPLIRENLISEIVAIVGEYDFDGVDIDFEYFPSDDNIPDFGSRFNQFLSLLKNRLSAENKKSILSVDIYPRAFIYDWPYELQEMGKIVDQVIIMAYDFTQRGSSVSGPVAPIKGESENEMSIVKTLQASLNQVDHRKLILGIPLYGYEWRTVSDEYKSIAYPGSGVTASYERVSELIKEEEVDIKWDDKAFSPWLVYEKNGTISQIYFDDLKSISLKVELVRQLNLGGVAFWALGYEDQDPDFWKTLKKKL